MRLATLVVLVFVGVLLWLLGGVLGVAVVVAVGVGISYALERNAASDEFPSQPSLR